MGTMLEVRDLTLVGSATAPGDIRFAAGEVTVILGRNHAGKTPLRRLLAGLPTTASGKVIIDGEDISSLPPPKRPVAMVYQAFVNYPHWQVRQNIASPLVAQSGARKIDHQRVREIAARVGIDDLLDRFPSELSGGQQQRLAIARALAKSPSILVMDEPLVNLDYKLRERLIADMRSMLLTDDMVIVYTTTDPADAMALADHLVLMDRGEVLQQGKPLDVYRNPASLRAANLQSDPGINLIDATRGVRPEHVSLDPVAGQSFPGVIRGVETNGADTFLHASVAGQDWVIKRPGMLHLAVDQTATFHVRDQDVIEERA